MKHTDLLSGVSETALILIAHLDANEALNKNSLLYSMFFAGRATIVIAHSGADEALNKNSLLHSMFFAEGATI